MLESDITYDAPAEELEIHDDELTIVAAPVYGGRVAETAMERLRAFHAHQAPVVPVVVYGNRDYEDALKELSDTLVDAGFVPVSAGAFVGEHSFSRKDMPIAAGRPDEADHEAAVRFGRAIKEKLGIKSGAAIPQIQVAGTLTEDQLREIAEIKMPDLNANDIEAAWRSLLAPPVPTGCSHRRAARLKKVYVPYQ